jgi:hypothetical protein
MQGQLPEAALKLVVCCIRLCPGGCYDGVILLWQLLQQVDNNSMQRQPCEAAALKLAASGSDQVS